MSKQGKLHVKTGMDAIRILGGTADCCRVVYKGSIEKKGGCGGGELKIGKLQLENGWMGPPHYCI